MMRQIRYTKSWKICNQNERTAVDLAYKIYGSQVTETKDHIILLHGLLMCKKNWDYICTKLTSMTKACIIAADARNHGDSPYANMHNYPELASDIAKLISKLQIQNAHFVGHSMGGCTAMTLALTEPSKVASLVVVDISPVTPNPYGEKYFRPLFKILKNIDFSRADNLDKAKSIAKESLLASGIVTKTEAFTIGIKKLKGDTFGWHYNLNVLSDNFSNIETFPSVLAKGQYNGPTLFIVGGRSKFVPKEDEPRIKVIFPHSELKYIKHVGHNVHTDDPEAFVKLLSDFFTKFLKT